jgi:hypothetical protein
MRSIRVRKTPISLASAPTLIPIGTRNSSRNTSPGCAKRQNLGHGGGSYFYLHFHFAHLG